MPANILPSGLSKAEHVARILQMQDSRSSHPIGPIIKTMTPAEREEMVGLLCPTPPAPVSATMPVDLDTLMVGDTIVFRSGLRGEVAWVWQQHRAEGTDYEYRVLTAQSDAVRSYRRDGRWHAGGETGSDIVAVHSCDTKPVVEGETPVHTPQPGASTDPAVALLEEAKRIVCGQRSQQYGSVEDNFGLIAAYWTAHLRGVGYDFTDPEQRLGATDVAILMMLMKCARLTADPRHKDSATDAAGYAACLARLQAKGEKPI